MKQRLCSSAGLPAAPTAVVLDPTLIQSKSWAPRSFNPEESKLTIPAVFFF